MPRREQRPPSRRRKRKGPVFDAGKVFRPADAKRDLAFNLDRETALYKASKGQGGSRSPPPVPPSEGGGAAPYPRGRGAV